MQRLFVIITIFLSGVFVCCFVGGDFFDAEASSCTNATARIACHSLHRQIFAEGTENFEEISGLGPGQS
jgi:hypothetical protein